MRLVHERNHFIWLTVSMIGLMITGAATSEAPANWTLELLEYVSVALLLLSLLSLKTNRKWTKGFVILTGIILLTVIARNATGFNYFEYFYLSLLLLFMLAASWLVGSQVLLTGRVNLNIIVGSVALYILIGYIFAILYTLLLELSPTALKGFEVAAWYDNLPTATYFSFVTLTTLGYGDISPATPLAEVIVILEAVMGMFYLAVIVASLIGSIKNKQNVS
ncbi:potassium channel family protein [Pseudomonadota bacterium]